MDTQIDAQFAAIADDVLAWKLGGACLCQAAGAGAAAALLLLAASPSPSPASAAALALLLARLLLAYGSTLLVLGAQRRVLAARDVPPVRLPLPRALFPAAPTAAAWPALFVARCVLRTRRPHDVAAALALYGAYAVSGMACVLLLGGGSGGGDLSSFSVLYGAALGLWFGAGHLLGCRNVVSYPTVDRLRWPRLRRRARAAARSALVGTAGAMAAALALRQAFSLLLVAAAAGTDGGGGIDATATATATATAKAHQQLHLRDVLGAWRAALGCALTWLAGAHALDVVFGEPVQFSGGDAAATAGDDAAAAAAAAAASASAGDAQGGPSSELAASLSPLVAPAALLAALRHADPIVQDWGMRDLCRVAEAGGARRRALFADAAAGAAGCRWAPACLAACLAELRRACDALSWGADGGGGAGAGAGAGGAGAGGGKMEALLARAGAAAAGAAGGPTPAADAGAWHLRAHTPRLDWAARALAALCAASLREDAYGVALESGSLAESVLALLALEAALQGRRRAVAAAGGAGGGGGGGGASGGGGGGGGDPCFLLDSAAESLLDAVQGGLYRVAGAFGKAIVPVVVLSQQQGAAAAPLPPPLRSGAEAAARLQRYLDGEV